MKEEGWRITFFCRAANARCTHSWEPTWDQLIQYFGPDADWVKDRTGFERLVCEVCGGRGATVIVQPSADARGMGGAGGAHDHGPMPSPEEIAGRKAEFEAWFRFQGFKTNAEMAAESRAERKRVKEAEKENSKHFIGPPNPWKYRKRGRWL
jgi:hypothetical protein